MSDKNYCGNGWENSQYNLINISVNVDKINEMEKDNYGCVKLTVAKMQQINAKSKATHTVYENTYKPNGGQRQESSENLKYVNTQENKAREGDDDLPF